MNDSNIDVIAELLVAVLQAKPDDDFCKSLQLQYKERGGLSKKQLEGLLGKATKFTQVNPGKLATLEAIIKKKTIVDRSVASVKSETVLDETPLIQMQEILNKNPEHKRILFLKLKWDKQEPLALAEKDDITRLWKLLCKK